MGIGEQGTYGTPQDMNDNGITTNGGVRALQEMMMLNCPKTQLLWASQLLVNLKFSQAETLIMMLGIDGILTAKLFPEGGEIHKMLIDCSLRIACVENDDPIIERIMKIDFELLAFMVTYKIDEYIEADTKRREGAQNSVDKGLTE